VAHTTTVLAAGRSWPGHEVDGGISASRSRAAYGIDVRSGGGRTAHLTIYGSRTRRPGGDRGGRSVRALYCPGGRHPSADAARRADHHLSFADRLLWPLLNRFVALPVSGGAPLGAGVARFLVGLGLPLVEGYGLTEAAPVVAATTLDDNVRADSSNIVLFRCRSQFCQNEATARYSIGNQMLASLSWRVIAGPPQHEDGDGAVTSTAMAPSRPVSEHRNPSARWPRWKSFPARAQKIPHPES
jgi:hypothetical protein